MTEPQDAAEQAVDEAVRGAVSASVALITRNMEKIDVQPAVLLEGTDPELVAQVLAVMSAVLLESLLPDETGRHVLIRVARRAADRERPIG